MRIWCASHDFIEDMVALLPPGVTVAQRLIVGDVRMGRLTAVGANSVVMPDNDIPEGVSIGALSFVPPRYGFEPWTVYAGVPIRRIAKRNKNEVLKQLEALGRQVNR